MQERFGSILRPLFVLLTQANPKITQEVPCFIRDLALICFWCDIGVLLHQIKEYESSKYIIHGAKQ